MIDIHSWPLKIKLLFLMAPFVFGISGVAISGYVAWSREFEVVNSSVQSSLYVEQLKEFMGTTSFRARWMITCAVCGLLAFSDFYVRKGFVSAEEVENFPASLRRRLVVSAWLTIIGGGWLIVGNFFIERTQ